jgi:hypothetical protein
MAEGIGAGRGAAACGAGTLAAVDAGGTTGVGGTIGAGAVAGSAAAGGVSCAGFAIGDGGNAAAAKGGATGWPTKLRSSTNRFMARAC